MHSVPLCACLQNAKGDGGLFPGGPGMGGPGMSGSCKQIGAQCMSVRCVLRFVFFCVAFLAGAHGWPVAGGPGMGGPDVSCAAV